MNNLETSLKEKWSDLLMKMDRVYENSELSPFDIDLSEVKDVQEVYNHKSHILENRLVLKEIEAIFIEIDTIEEKKKAQLQSLKQGGSQISKEQEKTNAVDIIATEPLKAKKVTKLDDDRRKKLLSSLPSQPRKLAEAAAAAATPSPKANSVATNDNTAPEEIESIKKNLNLNTDITLNRSIPSGPKQGVKLKDSKNVSLEFSMTDEEPLLVSTGKSAGKVEDAENKYSHNKRGVSVYTNSYNPKSCYITVGSTVAYKPKLTSNGGSMKKKIPDDMVDWFQCIVLRIMNEDGTRYEIQDIEAAETGLTTSIYKCNSREIIHIPLAKEAAAKHQVLKNYPTGMKCLGRYPDTTTFYPAVVIGKRQINEIWYCVLRFDGEEEVDKETLVERQFVLQLPKK
ncbi:hypothetical protein QEN19_003390 [Hanseniaspora menglaensis]